MSRRICFSVFPFQPIARRNCWLSSSSCFTARSEGRVDMFLFLLLSSHLSLGQFSQVENAMGVEISLEPRRNDERGRRRLNDGKMSDDVSGLQCFHFPDVRFHP